jgi:hypothetical protein
MQKRHDPSDFLTSRTSAKKGDVLGRMMPYSNIAAYCRSSSSFCSYGYR